MAEFNAPSSQRYSTRAFSPRPEGAATESVSSLKEQLRAKQRQGNKFIAVAAKLLESRVWFQSHV